MAIVFTLPHQDREGKTLPLFHENNWQHIDWRGHLQWPIPIFAEWLDLATGDRCKVEEWVIQDNLGDNIIIGIKLTFSERRDAIMFKLRWM